MTEQKIDYIDVNSDNVEKSTAERKIFYVDIDMGDLTDDEIKERIIKELKKKV